MNHQVSSAMHEQPGAVFRWFMRKLDVPWASGEAQMEQRLEACPAWVVQGVVPTCASTGCPDPQSSPAQAPEDLSNCTCVQPSTRGLCRSLQTRHHCHHEQDLLGLCHTHRSPFDRTTWPIRCPALLTVISNLQTTNPKSLDTGSSPRS